MSKSISSGANLKRPNGTGSTFISAQKPGVVQAVALDVHGVKRNKSFRFEVGNKASQARAENAATEWLSDMRRARELGQATFVANPKMMVSEFLDNWLASRKPPKTSENTYRNYSGAIKNWINPHIGNIRIQNISSTTIEDLNAKLVELGFAKGTTDVVHRVLSKAFKDAVKKRHLVINPMDGVDRIKQVSSPTENIPLKDFRLILDASSQSPYMHARVLIGMIVGPRPGEIYGLKWDDLNYQENTLKLERQVQRIKGKGLVFTPVKQKYARKVELPPFIMDALAIHRMQQDLVRNTWVEDEGLIFPNTIGRKLDAKRDSKWWKDLLKLAGVRHYTLYQMRKSAFSNLFGLGVDPKTVMGISGHTQLSTLMNHYVFPLDESKQKAVRLMDELARNIQ
jgi:integrase